jgi:leader peptidase (prepilin peptidase)/N-methyltransferase
VIVLVFVDYQHRILPNALTLPGTIAGILFCAFQDRTLFLDGPAAGMASILAPSVDDGTLIPWVGSVFGALVGSGVLLLVSLTYQILRKRQGLGMGDVKMMAFIGAFLGWRLALLTIFAGSLVGSLLGIFLILFRGQNLQSKMAFGTLLGAGATFSLFFGVALIAWYTAAP